MFSPAALIPRASRIHILSPVWASVQSSISIHIRKKFVHGHSDGEIPGPISNPEVKPICVDSCTVVREPTGTFVAVPSSFTPGRLLVRRPGPRIISNNHKSESGQEFEGSVWASPQETFWDTVR